jgi:hypothetical protein
MCQLYFGVRLPGKQHENAFMTARRGRRGGMLIRRSIAANPG